MSCRFYGLTADDAALQDAFYQLEKIFNAGAIDLATYLKACTRTLHT